MKTAFSRRRSEGCSGFHAGVADIGFETVSGGATYDFDGLKRGGEVNSPRLLLQFTLDGWGQFRTSGRWNRVGEGSMFSALIPSNHRYRVSPDCSEWTFFWIMIRHDPFVKRLCGKLKTVNRVWSPEPGSHLVASIEEVFSGVASGSLEDPWIREEAIFRLILAMERQSLPNRNNRSWENRVRNMASADWRKSLSVALLAKEFGLSRSAYSHAFRRRTGQTPAAFLRDLRTTEAGNLLKKGTVSIKEAAYATGFKDAAHFGKAFRRKFGVSPSEYRFWFSAKGRSNP